ncbi:MAG: flagellar motor switch protein FliN [candidate division Zixibacteria bacterium]|nr:flagellar motor switch protein FliN [candidate division Zixibacteria bacterium]
MTDEKLPNADDSQVDDESIETPEENLKDSEQQPEAEAEQPEAEVEQPEAEAEQPEAEAEQPEAEAEQPEAEAEAESSGSDNKIVNEDDESEEDAEAAMLAMLEDLPKEDAGTNPDDIDFGPKPEVSNAQFQHLAEPASKSERKNIDMLMDVNLPVAIELGRTKMRISDILALGPGSVVELNKLAGEPVDVLVNSKAVARGEVVVIDENFGVRVTQLLTAEERLKALNE